MNHIPNNKPFQPGQDERRNINGRPRKLKTILTGYGLTPSQTTELINEMMMHTERELLFILNSDDATIFETTIASALIKGKTKGSLYALDTILNRSQGLPKQTNDIAIENKLISVSLNLEPS
jgi:hypothetical protein